MKWEEKKTETYDFILTFNFKFVVGYSNILFVQQTKTKHNRKRNNTQTWNDIHNENKKKKMKQEIKILVTQK